MMVTMLLGIFVIRRAARRPPAKRRASISNLLGLLAFGAAAMSVRIASADPAQADATQPVDVVIHPDAAARRYVTVELNPLSAVTIGKWSANIVIAPIHHHALVLSPFYASTNTEPIMIWNDDGTNQRQLPRQKFRGFGGEIGYRYYFDEGGPRGLFIGPSLTLGSFTATADDGSETKFVNYGFAADAGYEFLVADRVALTLGAGVQYTATSKSIPDQQFPAKIYANNGVLPRILVSLGWAF